MLRNSVGLSIFGIAGGEGGVSINTPFGPEHPQLRHRRCLNIHSHRIPDFLFQVQFPFPFPIPFPFPLSLPLRTWKTLRLGSLMGLGTLICLPLLEPTVPLLLELPTLFTMFPFPGSALTTLLYPPCAIVWRVLFEVFFFLFRSFLCSVLYASDIIFSLILSSYPNRDIDLRILRRWV